MSHVKLGDLFRVGSSKRVLQSQWTTEGIPFYRGREITKLSESGFVENDLFITEELFKELSQRSGVPQAGDIMITAIGTIGNSYIVCPDDRFYFKDASVLWLARNSDVSSEYINHWLKSPLFLDQLDRGNGATVDTLTIQKLQGVLVHVPSASEQRRIVTLLDEAFADIATAKANAEKNLENADALFASALAATFAAQNESWDEKTIGQWVSSGLLAKPQDGNHGEIHPTKADYVETGVPFIMAADLMNGRVDTQNCRFISRVLSDNLRIGFAKTGDVLLSHKGTIGRVAILSTDLDYVMLTPQVTYYRSLDPSRLSPEFLYICLLSPQFQSMMNEIAGAGSTRAYIGITRQMDLKLAIPPLSQQIELSERLRAVESETKKITTIYRQKLTALDDLKKSLLHQAFSGFL